MNRIVIFTGDISAFSVRWGIGDLIDRFPQIHWLIVEHRPSRSVRTLVRNKWREVRREGLRAISNNLHAIVFAITARLRKAARPAHDAPGREYLLDAILAHPRVSLLRPGDIHASQSLAAIRAFKPDLGISLAAPILRPALFEIPVQGTINLHKGKLPYFRGMPPAFWEIWTGASDVGCSIHRVESKLDTGPMLMQRTIPIEPHSTVRGLQIALDRVGVEMMCEAVQQVTSGSARWESQASGGKTYRKPTTAQWDAIRSREPGRLVRNGRTVAKELVFFLYVVLVRPLPRLLLALVGRQRISVILYHRVSDCMRDSVTVGVEQFDRQMTEVKRHCHVVGIEDVVANKVQRGTVRPIVAITFDDGYRDNFEHAAPVLLRHELPAAFFVSTGLIGSDRGFPHDLEKLGKVIPAMEWTQVARMRRWGFVVGSHTETHVNCAKADAGAVNREIAGSMQTLRERLGLADVIFAYPYGGREDFNDHWRDRVRQVGYAGCLSAYGGCNRRSVDPFNVLRMGISCGYGKWAFRARLEGWA